ncbi:MAG TPA: hypothetical protein VGI45_33345 [Terracidiphilus sp.]|jgi:hypothetical protein
MKKSSLCLGLAFAVLSGVSPVSAVAQEKPGNVIMIRELTPKSGARLQLEEGLKQLAAWRASIKDPQANVVFEQITGENKGMFGLVSRGMHWADLDKPPAPPAEARAEFEKAMGDSVASGALRLYEEIPNLGHAGYPNGNQPAKYYEIETFHVPLGKEDRFTAALARFREAIEKTKAQVDLSCLVLAEGGQYGTWVLVFGHTNAAELAGPYPDEILKQAFGAAEAKSIVDEFAAVSGGFFTEEVIAYRPDLSYFPGTAK